MCQIVSSYARVFTTFDQMQLEICRTERHFFSKMLNLERCRFSYWIQKVQKCVDLLDLELFTLRFSLLRGSRSFHLLVGGFEDRAMQPPQVEPLESAAVPCLADGSPRLFTVDFSQNSTKKKKKRKMPNQILANSEQEGDRDPVGLGSFPCLAGQEGSNSELDQIFI